MPANLLHELVDAKCALQKVIWKDPVCHKTRSAVRWVRWQSARDGAKGEARASMRRACPDNVCGGAREPGQRSCQAVQSDQRACSAAVPCSQ